MELNRIYWRTAVLLFQHLFGLLTGFMAISTEGQTGPKILSKILGFKKIPRFFLGFLGFLFVFSGFLGFILGFVGFV